MFTGIIQDTGRLIQEATKENIKTLWIESLNLEAHHFKKGASIACNGVCLTVENYHHEEKIFQVSLVKETLEKTSFAQSNLGETINLEPALRVGDALGGHFVTGHVDGQAEIIEWTDQLIVQIPSDFLHFIAPQGSFTLHGVSLTVQSIDQNVLSFSIIPETKTQTNLLHYSKGDFLNFEVDYFARSLYPYIKSYLKK